MANTVHEALAAARRSGSFWLQNVELDEFPQELRQLADLRELRLSGAGFAEVPDWIGELQQLQLLDLANNPLKQLPAGLGELRSLRTLGLSSCTLENLDAVRGLRRLEHLVAPGNRITEIPAWIGELFKLRTLDLGSNGVVAVPEELADLPSLAHLVLWGHQLTRFPEVVRALPGLETIDLSARGTYDLAEEETPRGFLRDPLTVVRTVGTSSSRGSNAGISVLPEWIGDALPSLRRLIVGGQRLETLPDSLPSGLETVLAGVNRIEEVPAGVLELRRLRHLDLHDNRISELPARLASMASLEYIALSGNPLNIPPEVVEGTSPAALAEYLEGVQGATRRLDEAKLLVVGEGAVGKTSLIRRLTRGDFSSHENKTEGIEISRLSLDLGDDPIALSIWDFGGQEIMHATHQFFLTKRSLYVVVVDARQGEEQNRLEYWLKLIQSFSDSSPVIIVANKSEPLVLDMDTRGLKAKYPNIVDIVPVSCKNAAGLDDVRTLLEQSIARMPHVRDVLPLSFFDVKNELEQLDVDYLPFASYQEVCRRHGVDAEATQERLVGFLHDLGTVLCFRDDPRLADTNILNPAWVTGGVYRILNAHRAAQRKGLLTWADIDAILSAPEYPPQRRAFIVDMMKRFELCYEAEGTFLVPDLLTKEEPDTGTWDDALRFEVRYDVLPSSIISRLIVRMHTWISQSTVWRNGLVLAMDRNRALVKGDREDGVVSIWVQGSASGRRGLLTAIRSELRSIERTIPGLQGEERVPVPGHPGVWVPYRHLLDLESAGRDLVVPHGLTVDVRIHDLLAGVEAPEDRDQRLVATASRDEPGAIEPAPEAPPWDARESMRLGAWLFGGVVILVGVFLGVTAAVGPAAAGAITAAALAVIIAIAAIVLRSSGRLSEGGLLEALRSLPPGNPPQ